MDVVIPDPILLVSSIMYPDDPVTVRVASSYNVIAGGESAPVDDAVVEIFVAGNTPIANLPYLEGSNGLYRTEDFRPRPGVTYQVRVVAAGYDLAFANSFVPPASKLNSISSDNVERVEYPSGATYYFDFGMDFDDPDDDVNYYNLRLYQERRQFVILSNGDTAFTTSTVEPIVFPEAENREYRLAKNSGGILFIDNPFSSRTIPLSSSIDPGKEEIGEIYAELRTVSSDYYLYQESIIRGNVGINGGITPSDGVHNNVKNGVGNVSGYSSESDTLSLQVP